MNIASSRKAIDDLARLRSYISENDASTAQRGALYILHQVEAVSPDNPEFGRTGRVAGTRELVIPKTPFIVLYRVNGQSLEILRIYHAAQRWPEVRMAERGYGDDPYRQSSDIRRCSLRAKWFKLRHCYPFARPRAGGPSATTRPMRDPINAGRALEQP